MPADSQSDSVEQRGPLVSIVIPVYNGMPFIGRTIASVRQQTYSDWELLICDNRSGDGTVDFVRQHLAENPDDRIRLITHDQLLPMAENWNRSVKYARGDSIKVLPSDDILLPSCIEIQQRVLQDHPEVGFVTSGKEVINASDRRLFVRQPLVEGEYDWSRLGKRALCAVMNILGEPGGILFRRELLDSCGDYDTDLKYFVDIEILLRFLKRSNAFVWGSPLYQFRVHGKSASASSSRPALDEYLRLLDCFADELKLSQRPALRTYLKLKSRSVVFLRDMVFRFSNR